MEEIRNLVEQCLLNLKDRRAVLTNNIDNLREEIKTCVVFRDETAHTVEVMKMSSSVLQTLIEVVSDDNIRKIEELVNSALASVFWDLNLEMKIESDVKRNVNTRQIVVYKDGNRGTIRSNGGGIWAVIAAIQYILCNILLKRYPLIMFDESMSFVADKYVPSLTKFITGLSKDLKFSAGAITHKQSFILSSPVVYKVDFAEESLSGESGEEPYIKVERLERKNEEINI